MPRPCLMPSYLRFSEKTSFQKPGFRQHSFSEIEIPTFGILGNLVATNRPSRKHRA